MENSPADRKRHIGWLEATLLREQAATHRARSEVDALRQQLRQAGAESGAEVEELTTAVLLLSERLQLAATERTEMEVGVTTLHELMRGVVESSEAQVALLEAELERARSKPVAAKGSAGERLEEEDPVRASVAEDPSQAVDPRAEDSSGTDAMAEVLVEVGSSLVQVAALRDELTSLRASVASRELFAEGATQLSADLRRSLVSPPSTPVRFSTLRDGETTYTPARPVTSVAAAAVMSASSYALDGLNSMREDLRRAQTEVEHWKREAGRATAALTEARSAAAGQLSRLAAEVARLRGYKRPDELPPVEERPDEGQAEEERPDEGQAEEERPDEGRAEEERPDEGRAEEERPEGQAEEERPEALETEAGPRLALRKRRRHRGR
jgi:hypothetical protein